MRSRYLLEFQADILQTELHFCPHMQSTALGAALLAARHLDWDVSGWQQTVVHRVFPRLQAAQSQAIYREWQCFVQRVRNT